MRVKVLGLGLVISLPQEVGKDIHINFDYLIKSNYKFVIPDSQLIQDKISLYNNRLRKQT